MKQAPHDSFGTQNDAPIALVSAILSADRTISIDNNKINIIR